MQNFPSRFPQISSEGLKEFSYRQFFLDLIAKIPLGYEETIQHAEVFLPTIEQEFKSSTVENSVAHNLFNSIDENYKALALLLDPNEPNYDEYKAKEASGKIRELLRIENQWIENRSLYKQCSWGSPAIFLNLILYMLDQEDLVFLVAHAKFLSGFKQAYNEPQETYVKIMAFYSGCFAILKENKKLFIEKNTEEAKKVLGQASEAFSHSLAKLGWKDSQILIFFEQNQKISKLFLKELKKFLLKSFNSDNKDLTALIFEIAGLIILINSLNDYIEDINIDSFLYYISFASDVQYCFYDFGFKEVRMRTNQEKEFVQSNIIKYLKFISTAKPSDQGKALAILMRNFIRGSNFDDKFRYFLYEKSNGFPIIQLYRQTRSLYKEFFDTPDPLGINRSLFENLIYKICKLIEVEFSNSKKYDYSDNESSRDFLNEKVDFFHTIIPDLGDIIISDEVWSLSNQAQEIILQLFFKIVEQNRMRPLLTLDFKTPSYNYFKHQVSILENPRTSFVRKFQSKYIRDFCDINFSEMKVCLDLDWGNHNIKHWAIVFYNAISETNILNVLRDLFNDDERMKYFIKEAPEYLASALDMMISLVQEMKAWNAENISAMQKCVKYFEDCEEIAVNALYYASSSLSSIYCDETPYTFSALMDLARGFQLTLWRKMFYNQSRVLTSFYNREDNWENKKPFVAAVLKHYKTICLEINSELTQVWSDFLAKKPGLDSQEMKTWAFKFSYYSNIVQGGYISTVNEFLGNSAVNNKLKDKEPDVLEIERLVKEAAYHPAVHLFNRNPKADLKGRLINLGLSNQGLDSLVKRNEAIYELWLNKTEEWDMSAFKNLVPYMDKVLEYNKAYEVFERIPLNSSEEYELINAFFILKNCKMNITQSKNNTPFIEKGFKAFSKFIVSLLKELKTDDYKYLALIWTCTYNLFICHKSLKIPIQTIYFTCETDNLGLKLISLMLPIDLNETPEYFKNFLMTDKQFLEAFISSVEDSNSFVKTVMKKIWNSKKDDHKAVLDRLLQETLSNNKFLKTYLDYGKSSSNIDPNEFLNILLPKGIVVNLSDITTNKLSEENIQSYFKLYSEDQQSAYLECIEALDEQFYKSLNVTEKPSLKFVDAKIESGLVNRLKLISLTTKNYFDLSKTSFSTEAGKELVYRKQFFIPGLEANRLYGDALLKAILERKVFEKLEESEIEEFLHYLDTELMIKSTLSMNLLMKESPNLEDFYKLSLEIFEIYKYFGSKDKVTSLYTRGLWTAFRLCSSEINIRTQILEKNIPNHLIFFAKTYEPGLFDSISTFFLELLHGCLPPKQSIPSLILDNSFGSNFKIDAHIFKMNQELLNMDIKDLETILRAYKYSDVSMAEVFMTKTFSKENLEIYLEQVNPNSIKVVKYLQKIIIDRILSIYQNPQTPAKSPELQFISLLLGVVFKQNKVLKYWIAFSLINLKELDLTTIPAIVKDTIKRESITFFEFIYKIGLYIDPPGSEFFIDQITAETNYKSQQYNVEMTPLVKTVNCNLFIETLNALKGAKLTTLADYIWLNNICKQGSNSIPETLEERIQYRDTFEDFILSQDPKLFTKGKMFRQILSSYKTLYEGGQNDFSYVPERTSVCEYPVEYFELIKIHRNPEKPDVRLIPEISNLTTGPKIDLNKPFFVEKIDAAQSENSPNTSEIKRNQFLYYTYREIKTFTSFLALDPYAIGSEFLDDIKDNFKRTALDEILIETHRRNYNVSFLGPTLDNVFHIPSFLYQDVLDSQIAERIKEINNLIFPSQPAKKDDTKKGKDPEPPVAQGDEEFDFGWNLFGDDSEPPKPKKTEPAITKAPEEEVKGQEERKDDASIIEKICIGTEIVRELKAEISAIEFIKEGVNIINHLQNEGATHKTKGPLFYEEDGPVGYGLEVEDEVPVKPSRNEAKKEEGDEIGMGLFDWEEPAPKKIEPSVTKTQEEEVKGQEDRKDDASIIEKICIGAEIVREVKAEISAVEFIKEGANIVNDLQNECAVIHRIQEGANMIQDLQNDVAVIHRIQEGASLIESLKEETKENVNPVPEEKEKKEVIKVPEPPKYKYFIGRYFAAVDKFKQAFKESYKKIKHYREILILERFFETKTDDKFNLDWFNSQNFKDDFEKWAVLVILSNQNILPINPALVEKCKEVKEELAKINRNFAEYSTFTSEFKSKANEITEEKPQVPEKKPEEESKTNENGNDRGSERDDEENNDNNDHENNNDEDENDNGPDFDSVSDLSDFNKKEFEDTDHKEGMTYNLNKPTEHIFKQKFDLEGSWIQKNPDIVYKESYLEEKMRDEVRKKLELMKFRPGQSLLLYIRPFFYKYEDDNWDILVENLYKSFDEYPFDIFVLVEALIFIAHTPKLFDDSALETGPIYDMMKIQGYDIQTIRTSFLRNSLDFINQYFTQNFRDIEVKYFSENGLEALKPLKEKYHYTNFLNKFHSVNSLILAFGLYPEIYMDRESLNILKKILTEDTKPKERIFEVSHYSPDVDDFFVVALDLARNIYPNVPFYLEEYFNDLPKNVLYINLTFFEKLVPHLIVKLKEYLNHSHEKLFRIISKMRENNLDRNNLITGDIYVINKILYILNNVFCAINFKTTLTSITLKSCLDNLKPVLAERLNEVITCISSHEMKSYMLSLFEILDLHHKNKLMLLDQNTRSTFTTIGLYYCSLLSLTEEKMEDDAGEILPETPKLSKVVSAEEPDLPDLSSFILSKTFSSIRKDNDIDLAQVIMNFGLKYSKDISKLIKPYQQDFRVDLVHLQRKYPWIFDIHGKKIILDKLLVSQSSNDYPDSRKSLNVKRKHEIKGFKQHMIEHSYSRNKLQRKIEISFKGEPGIDAGGLRREFFTNLIKQLFNPDTGLFRVTASGKSIDINPASAMIPRHLEYFELAGIALAKTISQDISVDISLSRSLLKHILGRDLVLSDLEDIDPDLAKNMKWILENDAEDLGMAFTYETTILGESVTKELIPDGFNVLITNENKKDFVKKFCEMKMKTEIESQLNYFLYGFRSIYSLQWINHFTPNELEILIAGPQQIDIQAMKRTALYKGHSTSDDLIIWLWEFLESLSQEQLCQFLYFLTGSQKVAHGGFEKNPIKIISHAGDHESLPVAHTCFNELELPLYKSKEKLEEKLLLALYEGKSGFFVM